MRGKGLRSGWRITCKGHAVVGTHINGCCNGHDAQAGYVSTCDSGVGAIGDEYAGGAGELGPPVSCNALAFSASAKPLGPAPADSMPSKIFLV